MTEEPDPNITYRLTWVNGPHIADIRRKQIADVVFHLGESSWPGQIKMEKIRLTQNRSYGYGRDEDGE